MADLSNIWVELLNLQPWFLQSQHSLRPLARKMPPGNPPFLSEQWPLSLCSLQVSSERVNSHFSDHPITQVSSAFYASGVLSSLQHPCLPSLVWWWWGVGKPTVNQVPHCSIAHFSLSAIPATKEDELERGKSPPLSSPSFQPRVKRRDCQEQQENPQSSDSEKTLDPLLQSF